MTVTVAAPDSPDSSKTSDALPDVPSEPNAPTRRVRAYIMALGFLTLLAGFVLKIGYSYKPTTDGGAQPSYTDIVKLFPLRHLERHLFPYVGTIHIPMTQIPTSGHFIEYPVLTGLFIWACAHFVHTARAFFDVTSVGLALAGIGTTWLLARMSGTRALLWALSPVLVLYAFQNWDLLAVFATVAAIAAHRSGKPIWASVLIGIGACLKLYPALLIAPLLLDTAFRHGRRRAALVGVTFAGVLAAINLPIALISPSGWASPFTFQAMRNIDISTGSIWWIVPDLHMNGRAVDQISLLLLGLVSVLVLLWGRQRAAITGHWPFVAVSAALVVAFVEVNKVDSAQYAIWIAPFFVLLSVRWRWFVLWAATELGLYLAFFVADELTSPGFQPTYVLLFAVCRFLVQASLIPIFLTAREVDPATHNETLAALGSRLRSSVSHWMNRQRLTLVGIGVTGAVMVAVAVVIQHGPSNHTLVDRCAATHAHDTSFLEHATELASGHYTPLFKLERRRSHAGTIRWACGQYSSHFRIADDGSLRR